MVAIAQVLAGAIPRSSGHYIRTTGDANPCLAMCAEPGSGILGLYNRVEGREIGTVSIHQASGKYI